MAETRDIVADDTPLSGAQAELAAGRARLCIAQVGASLRELTIEGHDVLDGYSTSEIASAAQGQALVPWPNRLADGRYAFDGEQLQLALSEPEKSNAIHGLARWAAWDIAHREATRAKLSHDVWPQAGYPFHLRVEIHYELSDSGLTVTTTATNAGGQRLPYGLGFHPYLRVGIDRIDAGRLSCPPARAWSQTTAASRRAT